MDIKHEKFKRMIKKCCLSLASIIIVLSFFEAYLRFKQYYPKVLSIAPPYMFVNHAKTWWTLRPNHYSKVQTPDGVVIYDINSQGIRAPHDIAQNSLSPRIFVIGDSLTFGVGVDENIAFPRVLNNVLARQKIDAEVVNLGVAEFGTFHSFERLKEYAKRLGIPFSYFN
jgi:hypothetical protein